MNGSCEPRFIRRDYQSFGISDPNKTSERTEIGVEEMETRIEMDEHDETVEW